MQFDEFYKAFWLSDYPFNTFTTEDEKKKADLFVEPIDYALIRSAFRDSRTIIMSGNRGTGKTAIVYNLMETAPQKALTVYIDDLSSLNDEASSIDFYQLICSFIVNAVMEQYIDKGINFKKLSKEDKVFLSLLVSKYMTNSTLNALRERIERIQLSQFARGVNRFSGFIQFALNYGLNVAIKMLNNIIATNSGLPLIEDMSEVYPMSSTKFA